MFKNTKRKGFTLVELLVVIAIIAILATVSVVGYISLTKKADKSNDISLTTQMNTILDADEAGRKEGQYKSATEAFTALDANGITIDELTPYSTGYTYAWNINTRRMVLLDENDVAVVGESSDTHSDIVRLAKDNTDVYNYTGLGSGSESGSAESNVAYADSTNPYSIYLTTDFTKDLPAITVNISVDTGAQTVDVTYNATVTSDVYVRTNGGNLTVSASGAGTVTHYGTAGAVEVSGGTVTVNATVAVAKVTGGTVTINNTETKVYSTGGTVTGGSSEIIKSDEAYDTAKDEAVNEALNNAFASTNYVARIGKEGYDTLNEAIETVNTDASAEVATIYVIKNGTDTETITANYPVKLVFESDYTLNCAVNFYAAGNKIEIAEGVTLSCIDKKVTVGQEASAADLSISGKGTISFSGSYNSYLKVAAGSSTVQNSLTINDVTIKKTFAGTSDTYIVWADNYSSVNLENLNVSAEATKVVTIYAEGKYVKTAILNCKIDLNCTKYYAASYGIKATGTSSTCSIENSNISTTKCNALYLGTGTHTINGGKFTSDWSGVETSDNARLGNAIYVYGGKNDNITLTGNVKISSIRGSETDIGTSKESRAILIYQGILNIEGGEYSSLGQECIYILNGSSTGKHTNAVTLNISGGTFKITAPDDESGTKYLLNVVDDASNVTVKITGGTFYGFDPKDSSDNATWTYSGYEVVS